MPQAGIELRTFHYRDGGSAIELPYELQYEAYEICEAYAACESYEGCESYEL